MTGLAGGGPLAAGAGAVTTDSAIASGNVLYTLSLAPTSTAPGVIFDGAGAFRATRPEELADVLASGLAHDGPAVIEVLVSKEENVFPIVPAGANSRDMIFQSEGV